MNFVKIYKNIISWWDKTERIKSIYVILDKINISESQKNVYKHAITLLDDSWLISLEKKLLNTLEELEKKIIKKENNKKQKIKKRNLKWIRRKELLEKEREELELWILTSNL